MSNAKSTDQLLEERLKTEEGNSNRLVCKTMLFINAAYLIAEILNELDFFYVQKPAMRAAFFTELFVLAIPAVYLSVRKNFDDRRIKYVLMGCIGVTTFVSMIILNFHVTLMLFFPIVVAVNYHSKKLNGISIYLSVIIALIAPVIAFLYGTLDVSFITWLFCCFEPEAMDLFPEFQDMYLASRLDAVRGLLLFYGFPNALIIAAFAHIIMGGNINRNRIEKDYVGEIITVENKAQKAEKMAEEKAEFLATMSHEIRTPINAVLGMNSAILRECDDDNILNYSTDIDSAGKMLLSLINDVLDFSKLNAGKMNLLIEKYSLGDLFRGCYKLSEVRARDKNLDFEIEVDPQLPSYLLGDMTRLSQIVNNLLSNAVKYTQKGGISCKVSQEKLSEDTINLIIKVSDTGMGIRQEDQYLLFKPFKRIDRKDYVNIEGTGLGLSITAELIRLMNGTIGVESEYGKGSTFTVVIPQDIADKSPVGDIMQKRSVSGRNADNDLFSANDVSILVVDDVPLNIKVCKALLKNTGIIIDTADNGFDCLEKVTLKKYDLVLLDHAMPVKDGVETLHDMEKLENNLNSDTPIIAMTANFSADARDEYIKEGFDDYLSKPFSVNMLQETIIRNLPATKVTLKH